MRVKITLLEYGNKGTDINSGSKSSTKGSTDPSVADDNRAMTATNEVVHNIFKRKKIHFSAKLYAFVQTFCACHFGILFLFPLWLS